MGPRGQASKRGVVADQFQHPTTGTLPFPPCGRQADNAIAPQAGILLEGGLKMGRFHIRAFVDETMAGPGNRQPSFIIVSVSDAVGAPVGGLGAGNFTLDPMLAGPGAARLDIDRVSPATLPGVYQIQLVPIRREPWKAGAYIFGINVARTSEEGQTVATVLLD